MKVGFWMTAASAVAFFAPGIVYAQDSGAAASDQDVGNAEIIVTANRKSESVQSAPVSIAAITGESLAQKSVTQLDDAFRGLVGVSVNQGPAGLDPIIRGIGASLPAGTGGDNGISTTYDGVYNEVNIAARAGYYDLARIEVVRGPQGTLYGRNAEGGAVNVISNNPTQVYEGAFSVGAGNYSLVNAQAMVNVPVSESFAIRAAASVISRDGYLSNGQDDNHARSARIKALYKPSEAFSLLVGAEYSEFSGDGPGTVVSFNTPPEKSSAAYTSSFPSNQSLKRHGYKIWGQMDADIGLGTLTVIPAYQWLSAPDAFTFTGLSNVIQKDGSFVQKSVEARVASKPSSPFEWIVGAYYWDKDDAQTGIMATRIVDGQIARVLPTAATYLFDQYQTAKSKAVFGQVKVPLMENLKVVGGLRYSWDDKSYQRTSQQNAPSYASFTHFDWKAGAEFNIARHSLIYATAATGFRPGGLNPAPQVGATRDTPLRVFDSEELTSYEIGTKNEFLDRRLQLNASAYYYDYKGYQLPNLVPQALPGGGQITDLQIANLPKVTNYGAEVEMQFALTRADRLQAGVAYLHSKIDRPFILLPQNVQIVGQPLPNSPRWNASATYSHAFDFGDISVTPSGTLRYTSSYYVALPETPTSFQRANTQYDASITISSEATQLSLTAYVKNASYEVVKSNLIGGRMTLASPRLYGATFSARF